MNNKFWKKAGITLAGIAGSAYLIFLISPLILNPIIMGKTMKLHPVTIMIGLLIFGHFFGILGMVLATPIISCIKIIFNFFNEKYEIVNMINNK